MRKPIVSIGSEYQTDDLDLENEKIIVDYGEITLEEGKYYDAELYKIDRILVKSQNGIQNSELIFTFKVVEDESEHILEATYTNDSEEIISKLVLEVKLKDTGEIIEMKCNEPVGVGETSIIFKGKAPASGNIEDVEVLKYKLSLRSGTYMEYDTELNQYNWS